MKNAICGRGIQLGMKKCLYSFLAITISSTVYSKNYCVAKNGSDKNPGTSLEKPFATVRHAVKVMKPGDTVYIRAGVYNETINLSGKSGTTEKPFTIRSYKNEKVVLDGRMQLKSKWTKDVGNVYKTQLERDISQLFVDGELMTLARFPNAKPFSNEVWSYGGVRCKQSRQSSNGHVIDESGGEKSLKSLNTSLDGCIALLNFGAHATASRVVENNVKNSGEFDYSPALYKYKTTLGYFLEGGVGNAERILLDEAQEWAFDEHKKTLYLWADDGESPAERNIQGKVQTYVITGDETTKHITIDGLDFISTAFSFEKSDDITIKNCNLEYYTSSKRALGVLGPSETAQFIGTEEDLCTNIFVYNCTFQYADGTGLLGTFVENMRIENNLFHQIDYACVNNDNGAGSPFMPSSSIRMNNMKGILYKRNTLSKAGNAQGFAANRLIHERERKRFNSSKHNPQSVENIVCELNFHTGCGLLHKDGSSLYMAHASAVESVIRYNWFIGNGQRDFRWDGNNLPLQGVHGNLYRNVAVGTGIRRKSPSGGDGYRVKGSYHEVYHNLGLGSSEIDVAIVKGGNDQSVTKNNLATIITDDPLPGENSNNIKGAKKNAPIRAMLRNPGQWDFRPREDASMLIDKGTILSCSIKGDQRPINQDFKGEAPDIGAYEYGDSYYWIPGRQTMAASMPIPKNKAVNIPLDIDLIYLIGLDGTETTVYFGEDENSLKPLETFKKNTNIISPSKLAPLEKGKTYYWRVDTKRKGGANIEGNVWSFSTEKS